jgi:hypothetical protein
MTNRYSKGKIYRLVSDITDKIYIGSCCMPLRQRLSMHKKMFEYFKNGKRKTCCSSKELLEIDPHTQIVLIEQFPCNSKEELFMRERYWIENLNCVNKIRPIITKVEVAHYRKKYFVENKQQILEKAKQYREKNHEEISQKKKEYYNTHKDVIIAWEKANLDKRNAQARERRRLKKISNEEPILVFID